jgi:hypothetical protein
LIWGLAHNCSWRADDHRGRLRVGLSEG